jgi:hypothetical protein
MGNGLSTILQFLCHQSKTNRTHALSLVVPIHLVGVTDVSDVATLERLMKVTREDSVKLREDRESMPVSHM